MNTTAVLTLTGLPETLPGTIVHLGASNAHAAAGVSQLAFNNSLRTGFSALVLH
jgi:hypothetical protein